MPRKFFADDETITRRELAKSSDDVETLLMLASVSDVITRIGVACNRKAQREVLETLAYDEDRDVRKTVAKNPACPTFLLSLLADDADPEVKAAAVEAALS